MRRPLVGGVITLGLVLAIFAFAGNRAPVRHGPPAVEHTAPRVAPAPEPAAAPLPAPTPAAAPAPVEPVAPVTFPPTRPPVEPSLIADRRYEVLMQGRRAQTYHVRWSRIERDGEVIIQDVTRTKSRSARRMGSMSDVFEARTVTTLLRKESGELISQDTVSTLPSRTDRQTVERVPDGYRVIVRVGEREETFVVPTEGDVFVDAETFLGPRIRAGEAVPGATFQFPVLSTGRRAVLEPTLRVLEPDDECEGVKVAEEFEGFVGLWWFDSDGAVVRHRSGDSILQRNDELDPENLPTQPASYGITLPANLDLPRLFTGRRMIVDIKVRTDETVSLPRFAPNPWTEVLSTTDDTVRVALKSHDDAAARTTLPIRADGFEKFLEATPLMEVDDPVIRATARKVVGAEKDARTAAAKLADFVFKLLRKESPDIGQPSAKRILADRIGDCSEHCLLFTTLCRAAGIPARRVSGYVCIGPLWGGHAWCEIWVGAWIGADPTTNEIGTRARYIFCSRQDEPEVTPTQFVNARTTLMIREAEYADGKIDLTRPADWDPAIFSGIRVARPAAGWEVEQRPGYVQASTKGVQVSAWIRPDQGYRDQESLTGDGGGWGRFGSREAAFQDYGRGCHWIVPLGRENLYIRAVRIGDAELPVDEISALFRPTLERDDG